MVVDDNKAFRDMIVSILECDTRDFIECDDGRIAVGNYREERPDWSEVPTLAAVRTFIEAGLMFCLLGFERFYREVEVLREADQEFVVDADEFLRAAEQEAGINLPPAARSKALHEFSRSKRGTRWDLLNATTARVHDAIDAKSARELELLGGVIAGLR